VFCIVTQQPCLNLAAECSLFVHNEKNETQVNASGRWLRGFRKVWLTRKCKCGLRALSGDDSRHFRKSEFISRFSGLIDLSRLHRQ
jgi:hypothetical protein